MPFANIKIPEAALTRAQKGEIVHRVTNLLTHLDGVRVAAVSAI